MQTNKHFLEMRVKLWGDDVTVGCYDKDIEKLSKTNLKKVLDEIEWADTDVEVNINRKKYIVEIAKVGNEIDFYLLAKDVYIDRYGIEED